MPVCLCSLGDTSANGKLAVSKTVNESSILSVSASEHKNHLLRDGFFFLHFFSENHDISSELMNSLSNTLIEVDDYIPHLFCT